MLQARGSHTHGEPTLAPPASKPTRKARDAALSVAVHECPTMSDDEFARYQPHLVRQWQQRQQRLSSAGNLVSRKELETFMRHHPLRKTFIKDIVDGPLTEQQLIRALQRRATPLSSNQTDLEYVSLRCIDRIVGAACDRSGSSEGPRLGTFTFWPQVLFGAHFDMWTFVLRTAAAARGCTTGWRADRLAVLGIEFPTYSPSTGVHDWSNPASPLFEALTSSQVATHDAWWGPSLLRSPNYRILCVRRRGVVEGRTHAGPRVPCRTREGRTTLAP